jgi:type VI protein secretion system component VasA
LSRILRLASMIGCPPWQTLSVSAALALGVESAATLKTTAQKPTRALFQTASHLFMSSSQVVQCRCERAPSQDTPAGDHARQGVMNVRVSRAGQLQQGFAIGEMGSIDQFAPQKFWTAHVRFGSKADIKVG